MTTVTAEKPTPHPAKFHDDIVTAIRRVVLADKVARHPDTIYSILDPLAGVGNVHKLASANIETVGVEIEREWADQHPNTVCGNALDYLDATPSGRFSAIVVSPCYGNRMSDHHNARDKSRRNTYRHQLGRELSGGSSAGMQWTSKPDDAYKVFHRRLWARAVRVTEPGGIFVLNVKDHIRKNEIMKVTDWHITTLTALGLSLENMTMVKTPGNRQGENGEKRLPGEWVITFRKKGGG